MQIYFCKAHNEQQEKMKQNRNEASTKQVKYL